MIEGIGEDEIASGIKNYVEGIVETRLDGRATIAGIPEFTVASDRVDDPSRVFLVSVRHEFSPE